MKKLVFMLLALFIIKNTHAQKWQQMMKEGKNFYDIQKEFNTYFKDKNKTEKGNGYKNFKRWEYFVEPRVYPSGNLSQLAQTPINFQKFVDNQKTQQHKGGTAMIASTTWTAMGPFGALSYSASPGYVAAGRIDFVRIDPTNSQILYCGSPTGGLWKSSNGGTTWTCLNESLPVIGCSDLAIDPFNTNILYLATGDGDTQYSYSMGIMKSTDGGVTWNPTGISYSLPAMRHVLKLIIDPLNPQILLASTTQGVYRTTNGATTWTLSTSTLMEDIHWKPGNASVVYACGYYGFYVSNDNGVTFTPVTNGIPNSGIGGMVCAVTPADTNYVYALTCNSSGGFGGFYLSNNGGVSFTVIPNSLNILGYNTSSTSGLGAYAMCMDASPINQNLVMVGGIYPWFTANAGVSWTALTSSTNPPYIHPDTHCVLYGSNNIYICNDGGLHEYNSGNLLNKMSTMNVAEIYKMGMSSLTPDLWITGLQDNGSSIRNSSGYYFVMGGDGMDCFFDRTNDNNVFAASQYGGFSKSINGGSTFGSASFGITGTPDWIAPWKQHPSVATTLYAGYTDMWISTNSGASWTQLGTIPAGNTIKEFVVAPTNTQVIYAIKSTGVFKTVNGGTNWTNITGSIPTGFSCPSYITIDPSNDQKIWVTVNNFSVGNKVFKSTDGGTTWTNISFNLPNIPANCVYFQPNTNDRVYVGMDLGVYYIDNSTSTWTLFNINLPNTPVFELQTSPASPGKLYAATYGRGVFKTDISIAPTSSFATSSVVLCEQTNIPFTDLSLYNPTAWSWSVSPSGGVIINSPNSQNPGITFPGVGIYTVSMVASNSGGTGLTYTQQVSINPLPVIIAATPSQTICAGSAAIFSVSGTPSYTWSDGGGNNSLAIFTPTAATTFTAWGTGSNGCVASVTMSVLLDPCVGIKEQNSSGNIFKVSPNPNKGNFTLEITSDADINVYSTLGNLVLSKKVKAGKNNFDLGNLSNGIYYLQAVVNKRTSVVKIIKEE